MEGIDQDVEGVEERPGARSGDHEHLECSHPLFVAAHRFTIDQA
jgi:hypothetical protein